MKRRAVSLLALLLATRAAAPGEGPAVGPSRVGEMAPVFTLPDLDGNAVSLESLRGRKVVQIVGWATWCRACRQEIPRLVETYEKHRGGGFEILAITGPMSQGVEQVKAFARRMALPYPILYDESTRVLQDYRIYFVPYTLILDRTGRIVYEGSHLPNDYEKRIETLLAAGAPG